MKLSNIQFLKRNIYQVFLFLKYRYNDHISNYINHQYSKSRNVSKYNKVSNQTFKTHNNIIYSFLKKCKRVYGSDLGLKCVDPDPDPKVMDSDPTDVKKKVDPDL